MGSRLPWGQGGRPNHFSRQSEGWLVVSPLSLTCCGSLLLWPAAFFSQGNLLILTPPPSCEKKLMLLESPWPEAGILADSFLGVEENSKTAGRGSAGQGSGLTWFRLPVEEEAPWGNLRVYFSSHSPGNLACSTPPSDGGDKRKGSPTG